MRPSYTPPTRWKLANPLLEKAYNHTKLQIESIIAASAGQLTLVSDSWTNQRTESVVNYVAMTRQHAIFLKTEHTGSERHTGEVITRGLKATINEIGGGEAVIAVTTDNASNIKRLSWSCSKPIPQFTVSAALPPQ